MIEIIEMQPFHVPWIAELEKICFHDPWSERSIASELENPLSHWLVAMDGEKLVGYVGSQTVLGGDGHDECGRLTRTTGGRESRKA